MTLTDEELAEIEQWSHLATEQTVLRLLDVLREERAEVKRLREALERKEAARVLAVDLLMDDQVGQALDALGWAARPGPQSLSQPPKEGKG